MVVIHPVSAISEIPEILMPLGAKLNDEGAIVIHFSPSVITVGQILQKIAQTDIEIADLKTEESDLEDIFLQLTKSKQE